MNNYSVTSAQTAIFDKYGTFFAFSAGQLNKGKKEGVKYESGPGGMVSPVGTVRKVYQELGELNDKKVKYELENNSIKDLIWDSLANYECQITGDWDDAVEALEEYGITADQVKAEYPAYFQHCCDNDYF